MKQFFTRQRRGKTYRYFDGEQPVTDERTIERLNKLAIPPAWREVQIARSPRAKVQAIGLDKAGRRQSIYSPTYRARQEATKFARIMSFGHKLPALRAQLQKDLARKKLSKEKVLACIVTLMDQAYFRVGNDTYAREHQTYGITTLRSRHATIKTTSVTFDFVGKSGKQHHKTIKDRQLARIIRQLDELPGYEIFKYIDNAGQLHQLHAGDVNAYIKHHMGDDYTAKDFRTWGGTLLAATALAATKPAAASKARQKNITRCVKRVAARLGNTPAVARQSYIDPRIIEKYLQSTIIHDTWQTIATMQPKKYLQPEEQCVLTLLENV